MTARTRIALILSVSLLALSIAAPAFAAPAPWKEVDVGLIPGQTGGTMIVSGELPEGAKLPAEGELSIPASSTLQWIGEILGGDPSADPKLTYTKTTVGESDIYRFTMTKARIAQIEYTIPTAYTAQGGKYAMSIRWLATQDVSQVRISAQLPSSARIVDASPDATTQPGAVGSVYYFKQRTGVKAGEVVDLTFTYEASTPTAAAAPAPAQSSGAGGSGLPTALAAIAAMWAVILFVVARRKKSAPEPVEDPPGVARRKKPAPEPVEDPPAPKKARSVKTASSGATPAKAHVEEPESEDSPSAPMPRRRVRLVGMLVIVAALIFAALWAGDASNGPRMVDGVFSKKYSERTADQTVEIPLDLSRSDPASAAENVFDVLGGVPGMASATLDVKASVLQVGFCTSSASEASIRTALAPTGVLSE